MSGIKVLLNQLCLVAHPLLTMVRVKTPGYIFLCALWLFAATAGAWKFLNYENTPTAAAATPSQWPDKSHIARQSGRPTLVMFAHPHCPCTKASVGELNRLLTRCQNLATVRVLFIQPKDTAADWTETSLRRSAEAIPGVKVQLDHDGEESRLFGAESSGYLVLYGADGKLLFHGGITAARGHEGDNAGENVVVALLNGQHADLKQTDVFGCSLYDHCEVSSK
jgi:hypothetical protein